MGGGVLAGLVSAVGVPRLGTGCGLSGSLASVLLGSSSCTVASLACCGCWTGWLDAGAGLGGCPSLGCVCRRCKVWAALAALVSGPLGRSSPLSQSSPSSHPFVGWWVSGGLLTVLALD